MPAVPALPPHEIAANCQRAGMVRPVHPGAVVEQLPEGSDCAPAQSPDLARQDARSFGGVEYGSRLRATANGSIAPTARQDFLAAVPVFLAATALLWSGASITGLCVQLVILIWGVAVTDLRPPTPLSAVLAVVRRRSFRPGHFSS
jgi:hypothetical protein